MPVWIQVVGAIVLIISFYLFYLVIRENPYLSPAILVQKEREQTVIKTGPYPALILTILIVISSLNGGKDIKEGTPGL